jgi:hypothetical protein
LPFMSAPTQVNQPTWHSNSKTDGGRASSERWRT